jgi:hypothetical protein
MYQRVASFIFIHFKFKEMTTPSSTQVVSARTVSTQNTVLGAILITFGAIVAALPACAYFFRGAWRRALTLGRKWLVALVRAATSIAWLNVFGIFGQAALPAACCVAAALLVREGLFQMGASDEGMMPLWTSMAVFGRRAWAQFEWVLFAAKMFGPIAVVFKILHVLESLQEHIKPNPRKDVVLVQVNFLPGTSLPEKDSFAYAGPVQFPSVHSMPVQVPKFRKLLARAREKRNALIDRFPNLHLLNTEADHSQSQIFAWLHDHATNVVRDTSAVVHAACGLNVKRYVFVACITFDKSAATPKMRMLVMSKKQLKFLLDNPDYPDSWPGAIFGKHANQRLRLTQLREFAKHVEDTGGFLTPGDPKCKHKDEWMMMGKPRYWTKFEVCRPDYN